MKEARYRPVPWGEALRQRIGRVKKKHRDDFAQHSGNDLSCMIANCAINAAQRAPEGHRT